MLKQAMRNSNVDFSNTEIAFSGKTDKELKRAAWLFKMMNNKLLVNTGSKLGLMAFKMKLPFVSSIVRNTLFDQFVGGTTLLETQKSIDHLAKYKTLTILDYGAEAKTTEKEYNQTMTETIRAIEFAANNNSVPVVSTKITGMARFGLLEEIHSDVGLTKENWKEYRAVLKRIDSICHVAHEKQVGVFFDAEESWIQESIDHIVQIMMKRYNKNKVIVYNTFQMYRKDRLQFLTQSFDIAKKGGYKLGAKIVRGAYMEKERARAKLNGYASPIHDNKAACDDAFNTAIKFCVNNYENIASCNATHNAESCLLQAKLIAKKDMPNDHPHLNFCQLYGMSDHITFNLAAKGYNVAKYVPYGQVKEVMPYLIRRAQENTAMAGSMSREYQLVVEEMNRRKLS